MANTMRMRKAPIAFVNALNVDRTAGVSPLPHAVVAYDEDTGQAKRGPNGRVERVGRGEVGLVDHLDPADAVPIGER